MEGVTDVIMSLSDASTDVALGGVFTAIMAMHCATDGAIGPRMLTNTRGAFNIGNPKLPPNGCLEVAIIHSCCSFLRDEVGTRFGA